MTESKLAYMANQIATFFATRPAEAAAEGVASHINQFWEPRMRRQLLEMLERDPSGLHEAVVAAGPAIRRPA
jgi:formate dehydrogenase subunit delta